jgi:hypothetical protein
MSSFTTWYPSSDREDEDEGVRLENVRCVAETEKALLCKINGKDCWVPKSQITDDGEVYEKNHEGTLIITEWFAKKAGLV